MMGLAYELIGFMVAPPLIGYVLDTRVFEFTGGRPGLFVFIGLFAGFAGGGWHLYRRLAAPAARGPAVSGKSAIIKEESVARKVERIGRELDEVGRKIDRATGKPSRPENRDGGKS